MLCATCIIFFALLAMRLVVAVETPSLHTCPSLLRPLRPHFEIPPPAAQQHLNHLNQIVQLELDLAYYRQLIGGRVDELLFDQGFPLGRFQEWRHRQREEGGRDNPILSLNLAVSGSSRNAPFVATNLISLCVSFCEVCTLAIASNILVSLFVSAGERGFVRSGLSDLSIRCALRSAEQPRFCTGVI
jgi:hypothetical protein